MIYMRIGCRCMVYKGWKVKDEWCIGLTNVLSLMSDMRSDVRRGVGKYIFIEGTISGNEGGPCVEVKKKAAFNSCGIA